VAKFLALAAPEQGPDMAVELCNYFNFSSTCGTQFSRLALGSVITQVVANADVGGVDGQVRSNSVRVPRTYALTLHNCSLYATIS
jgi:sphingomyelin phosphodiesterase